MKTMPMISKFMTTLPETIEKSMPLKTAIEKMRTHQIRHLPVLHGGQLFGIVTDRDIKLASAFKGAETMTVEDVMTPEPYICSPDAPLDQVISEMADHKFGCALVVQPAGKKLVGIFTAVDALTVLNDQLKTNYRAH